MSIIYCVSVFRTGDLMLKEAVFYLALKPNEIAVIEMHRRGRLRSL